ncbi:hypothetical protein CK203_102315 [Vitis vinifera]|uniref:Uncharacterized protein n=1 Tax=Vitis vinifera TaxID=29760 RepID=A0A438DCA9_VITVI|nr:hypothetical protein CK203_102315 [Vitis vinifera]
MLSQTVVYSVENCLPRVCVLFSWICLFASHSIILLQPITMLSFIGKSEYLVSASRGSKSQLSLWSLSKLSESWSYKLQAEAVACVMDGSYFAVLTLLPRPSKHTELTETKIDGRDGRFYYSMWENLFLSLPANLPNLVWCLSPIPQKPVIDAIIVFVAKGGGLAFIHVNSASFKGNVSDGKLPPALLAYINGNHEYVLFNPYNLEAHEPSMVVREKPVGIEDETGKVFVLVLLFF